MRSQKLYAVADVSLTMLGRDHLDVSMVGFRTLRTKPRNVLDMRKHANTSLDGIRQAICNYYMRKARYPDRIRLPRQAFAAFGRPAAVYGIKVTL